MAIKNGTSWQAKSDTLEKKWEDKLFAFYSMLESPLGRHQNSDGCVSPSGNISYSIFIIFPHPESPLGAFWQRTEGGEILGD
ncbi:MAG TPA: hypothetical protein PLE33_08195 [Candidatus Cloacimonas sp.]|nr:hypothetical protein [Candidatus Cloacimonas sp.]